MGGIIVFLLETPVPASIPFIVSGYQCPDTEITMGGIIVFLLETPAPASIPFIVSGY